MQKLKNKITKIGLIALGFALHSTSAIAAPTTTDTMPWEGGLSTIANSLQGPTAYAVAIIGFIVAGIGFVIQGELSGWSKKMIQIVMGIAVLLGVVGLIGIFFGVTTATVI